MKRVVRLPLAVVLAAALLAIAPVSRAAINAADAVPAATLLLPYFEVDLTDSVSPGPTTVLHVGNAGAAPVLAHLTLWTDQGVPTRAVDIYIGGNDVVEIDVRLLLNGVVPQRATNPWTGNVGSQSAAAVGFANCPATWPEGGRLSAADVAGLKAAHTGAASSVLGGLCGARSWGDNVARGYITIDTVNRCSPVTTFPSTAGYFAAGGTGIASNQNVLFGDYTILDRSQNSDTSDTLVHVEASGSAPETTQSGRYTFYGRLASVNGTAVDNREALFDQWMTRFVNGGVFSGGTKLTVWRDPGPRVPFACANPPAPLGQQQAVPFDEQERPASIPGTPLFPLATESVALASPARIPIPYSFGFLFLDLRLTTAAAPFGTANQSWVSPRFLADGRFATGFSGWPLTHVGSSIRTNLNFPSSECNDGIDNDGDSLVDFPNDPGCESPAGIERPQCSDGIDNDADGLVDFPNDPSCSSLADGDEFFPRQCGDGVDNDGDGSVDMNDPGCSSPNDPTEAPNGECGDGVDNDGDTLVDFPADPGCTSASDATEAPNPQCSDGIDNDGDTLIDFPNDPGCTSATDTTEATPACSDGLDNDGDTLIDFPNDPGCASATSTVENPACSNGTDDDGDTLVDFPADPGCSGPSDPLETAGPNECSDGRDNDGDGFVDFPADPDCGASFDPTERPDCSNDQDDDQDGFVDFPLDTGCASAADRNEKAGTTTRQCNDGVDNDGDGLVDFPQDPGCISKYDDNEYNGN